MNGGIPVSTLLFSKERPEGFYAKGAMKGSIEAPSLTSFQTEVIIRTALTTAIMKYIRVSRKGSGHFFIN